MTLTHLELFLWPLAKFYVNEIKDVKLKSKTVRLLLHFTWKCKKCSTTFFGWMSFNYLQNIFSFSTSHHARKVRSEEVVKRYPCLYTFVWKNLFSPFLVRAALVEANYERIIIKGKSKVGILRKLNWYETFSGNDTFVRYHVIEEF